MRLRRTATRLCPCTAPLGRGIRGRAGGMTLTGADEGKSADEYERERERLRSASLCVMTGGIC